MNHDMEHLLRFYLMETNSFLEQFDTILLDVRKQQSFSHHYINELFGILHTIKGSSSMMQFSSITEVTHKMEELLSDIQSQGIDSLPYSSQEDLLQLLYSFSHFLRGKLESIENRQTLLTNIDQFTIKIKNVSHKIQEETTKQSSIDSDFSHLLNSPYIVQILFPDDIGMEKARALVTIHSLQQQGFSFEQYPVNIEETSTSHLQEKGLILSFITKEKAQAVHHYIEHALGITSCFLTSPAKLLESFSSDSKNNGDSESVEKQQVTQKENRLPSTLVVQASKVEFLEQLATKIMQCQSALYRELKDSVPENSTVFSELTNLQELSMKLEQHATSFILLPLSLLFEKVELLLHTLKVKLDKEVQLITSGEELMITKPAFDALNIACTHLVRNAMDHGIESSKEERIALGKPEIGTISISTSLTSSGLSFTVQDDGRGINTTSILKEGKLSGNLTKSPSLYTDSEIFDLIFLPGLTTKDTVSEFSGRGIGMNAVSQSISSIGGTISIESELAKGTSIKLSLPYSSIFSY